MDRSELTERVVILSQLLKEHGVHVDVVLLFESRARNQHHSESDFVPVGLMEYMDTKPISPILVEIKRDGIPLI